MRLLFVRPPKYLWPYMNEQDNFLLSQAMACLGAEARRAGHDVTLLDCMPLRMGWRTLAEKIRELRPDVLLCGDSETMFEHDSGRVFRLAKSVDPSIFTVSGGVHFSHAAQDAFGKYPIDAIVRGEGEVTLRDLLEALEKKADLAYVPGLALPDGEGGVHYTASRKLIEDLDSLPFPAYDLLPMERYGAARYLFSPGGVTIHHSRGCIENCTFCACWLQMASREGLGSSERLRPRWRTRSPVPVVEEMEVLAKKYGKRCQVFVDDAWNAAPGWSGAFTEELNRRRLGVNWFAFMRADHLLRDVESGLFAEFVRSGLTHFCVGLERAERAELEGLDKHNIDVEGINRTIPMLRSKYPGLFVQTTFIVGLRQDTKESLDRLLAYVEKLNPDYPAFHPLTPVPGTAMWRQAAEEGWLEVRDYARYDWMTAVMPTETMSREELERKILEMNGRYMRPARVLRGIFSLHQYRRRMYLWWFLVSIRVFWRFMLDRILPAGDAEKNATLADHIGMVRPAWYDH